MSTSFKTKQIRYKMKVERKQGGSPNSRLSTKCLASNLACLLIKDLWIVDMRPCLSPIIRARDLTNSMLSQTRQSTTRVHSLKKTPSRSHLGKPNTQSISANISAAWVPESILSSTSWHWMKKLLSGRQQRKWMKDWLERIPCRMSTSKESLPRSRITSIIFLQALQRIGALMP